MTKTQAEWEVWSRRKATDAGQFQSPLQGVQAAVGYLAEKCAEQETFILELQHQIQDINSAVERFWKEDDKNIGGFCAERRNNNEQTL